MKRKLVNIGVFARPVCCGAQLAETADLLAIYNILKVLGFRETRWQLIYDGQIAGLVYPYNNGLNEIHIRFYRERVFTELEFSRSSILHFFIPQYNANKFILDLLEPHISLDLSQKLTRAMVSNLRTDELCKREWNYKTHQNPYLHLSEKKKSINNAFLLHKILSWRTLVTVNAILSSLVLSTTSPLLTTIFCLTLISLPFIPAVGKP